jgi:hypothetical protein
MAELALISNTIIETLEAEGHPFLQIWLFMFKNPEYWIALSLVSFLIAIVEWLFLSYVLWKIAKKLEVKDYAWWAWVPVLNFALIYRMGGQKFVHMIYLMIPCVSVIGLVYFYIAWVNILKKLGKPEWHVVFIFIPIVNIVYLIKLTL